MWMPSLLKAFSETYPLIQITLLEGGNKEIAKWLAENLSIFVCALSLRIVGSTAGKNCIETPWWLGCLRIIPKPNKDLQD